MDRNMATSSQSRRVRGGPQGRPTKWPRHETHGLISMPALTRFQHTEPDGLTVSLIRTSDPPPLKSSIPMYGFRAWRINTMGRRPKPGKRVPCRQAASGRRAASRRGRPWRTSVRSLGVTELTCCRWRKEYGGLKLDQVKRLKELETERRPAAQGDRRSHAGQELILKEAASGSF